MALTQIPTGIIARQPTYRLSRRNTCDLIARPLDLIARRLALPTWTDIA